MRGKPNEFGRRSVRMSGYDYSQPGAYFITVDTHESECTLGEVVGDEVVLNPLGQVVAQAWEAIPQHFPHVELDEFKVMPNHVHGIIVIKDEGSRGTTCRALTTGTKPGTACRAPTDSVRQFGMPVAGSIPTIVGAFKAAVARWAREHSWPSHRLVWQRGYYEHVIRDEDEWEMIARYIAGNPSEWNLKRESDAKIARRRAAPRRWSGE